MEERERACDEAVLELGSEPQVYAESILKTCEFCVESPLACVSGVTGAELKKRIVRIVSERMALKLSFGRKLLLASFALAAVLGPLVLGLKVTPQVGRKTASLVVSTGLRSKWHRSNPIRVARTSVRHLGPDLYSLSGPHGDPLRQSEKPDPDPRTAPSPTALRSTRRRCTWKAGLRGCSPNFTACPRRPRLRRHIHK